MLSEISAALLVSKLPNLNATDRVQVYYDSKSHGIRRWLVDPDIGGETKPTWSEHEAEGTTFKPKEIRAVVSWVFRWNYRGLTLRVNGGPKDFSE